MILLMRLYELLGDIIYRVEVAELEGETLAPYTVKSVVLEPGFGVENLFDKVDDRPWNSNYSTLNPGRSFYVSLSVRFN